MLRVAVRPKRTTSTGSGKAPSVATRLEASAMTIMRSEDVATIFSRSSAPPPPLMRRSSSSSSSAPSIVRSRNGVSSSVVMGMPSALGLLLRRLRGCTHDDIEPGAHLRAQEGDELRRGRARAEAELHAGLDEGERALGHGQLQGVGAHAEAPREQRSSTGSASAIECDACPLPAGRGPRARAQRASWLTPLGRATAGAANAIFRQNSRLETAHQCVLDLDELIDAVVRALAADADSL